mmetsp:Transcript_141995/g.453949  ORF Transcript_141995/g.453949 Transcript_141995/m.453949 type:complete len:285 (+) Transcript_141995:118-972(+)
MTSRARNFGQVQPTPNTKISGATLLGRADGRNNLNKLRLQGRAAHEEAIDVWASRKLRRVLRVRRATVLDADACSALLAHIGSDPLANLRMRLLRLLGGGGDTSADSPDWLVRDDHLLRVQHALDLLQLCDAHGHGGLQALLALWELLANAKDALHARIKDVLQLRGQELVALGEVLAALRVADQAPLDLQILHLLHGHLAGVRPAALEVAVLWAHRRTVGDLVHAIRHVKRRWADINVALAHIALVDVLNEAIQIAQFLWVALPIATDDWLACGHGVEGRGKR